MSSPPLFVRASGHSILMLHNYARDVGDMSSTLSVSTLFAAHLAQAPAVTTLCVIVFSI
jgi:hypothetical protein